MTAKEFIENNIDLIDNKNWEEFFKKAPAGIGAILYEAGIPFMEELGYIPRYAFYGCNSLTSMSIPNNVTSIGERAFYSCSNLMSINIPSSMTSIGIRAFSGCSSLKSVTISNGVTSIGEWAFSSCRSLTSITIPDSVTSIDGCAFNECGDNLTINYDGTKAQWKNIYAKDAFKNTYFTVHCTDGDIIKRKR